MEKRPSIVTDEKAKSRREREWTDDREEEESSSPYEPCYRDGSVKHECWRDE